MTSSDVVDTALSLQMKESANAIILGIKEFTQILRKMAIKHKNTLIMGRTHGVHAEPTTFGLKLALFMVEMQRNLERMESAKKNISVGKISGAVVTYSNIDPKVEELACKTLDLDPVKTASQIIQRDRHAQYLTTIAIIGGTLEKIALEIRGMQRTEVAEAEEPFRKGQKGSSAMPHKKNPITCERVCGLARVLRGNALVSMENIALWQERDISHSSTERIIIPDSTALLHYMLYAMIRVMDNLVVNTENMKRNVERTGGLIFSQRFLLALIDKGLKREDAYKIIQSSAMLARSLGKNLKSVVMEDPQINKKLSMKEIDDIFDIKY
jgi:adenylosuccinate lyase